MCNEGQIEKKKIILEYKPPPLLLLPFLLLSRLDRIKWATEEAGLRFGV
jgi:hypothetical protein